MCCYTPSNASDHVADTAASPTKRRHLDTSPPSISSVLEASEEPSPQTHDAMQAWEQTQNEQQSGDSSMSGMTTQLPISMPAPDHVRQGSFHNFKKLPNRNNANGLSEETNIYTETRMLQDQTGRLRRCSPSRWAIAKAPANLPSSLHWRRVHTVHPAADPHRCREHSRVGYGLTFHR